MVLLIDKCTSKRKKLQLSMFSFAEVLCVYLQACLFDPFFLPPGKHCPERFVTARFSFKKPTGDPPTSHWVHWVQANPWCQVNGTPLSATVQGWDLAVHHASPWDLSMAFGVKTSGFSQDNQWIFVGSQMATVQTCPQYVLMSYVYVTATERLDCVKNINL